MNVYLIYGVTDCPSCLRAQAILMDLDIEYVFIDMSFSKTYMKSIKKQFDWPTFPVIVEVSSEDGEKLIGGFDQLFEMIGT